MHVPYEVNSGKPLLFICLFQNIMWIGPANHKHNDALLSEEPQRFRALERRKKNLIRKVIIYCSIKIHLTTQDEFFFKERKIMSVKLKFIDLLEVPRSRSFRETPQNWPQARVSLNENVQPHLSDEISHSLNFSIRDFQLVHATTSLSFTLGKATQID